MNILLIGSGGREHALAWKLAQSPLTDSLFAAPGNPGIAEHAELVALDVGDHAAVVAFCKANTIGLVVIGPEGPLVDGLADSLRAADVPAFGPGKLAAQLEGSKGFTKDLCARHDIPTAAFSRHDNATTARSSVGAFGYPVVIKADGLAAGKGVVIAETEAEALSAVDAMFDGAHGAAGAEIVIEEFMTGEEASLFALTDGTTVVAFGSAQDHKRVGEGDTGPNTGGMGAYSPASVLTPELQARAMHEIIEPTVKAMRDAGMPFVGVLYAGLMLTPDGPKLIEYNARFGDPETQVLMPRFDGDLTALLLAVSTGTLDEARRPVFRPEAALTVVMAARGYPGDPQKNGQIHGVTEAARQGALIFHAGTRASPDGLFAAGGRVLNVTCLGDTVTIAKQSAYKALDCIEFPTGFFRRDIGWREVEREMAVT
ncbi:MAG: purD [Sphingomonadales bacterium]|nr:purD [Sphingomonadales bacterium]